MYRKLLLAAGAADLFILSWLDRIAFDRYYYWRHPRFDILMHFWGGMAVGFVSTSLYLWLQAVRGREGRIGFWRLAFWNALSAFLVGAAWEAFEAVFDRVAVFSPADSVRDICFGLAGSLLAGLLSGILASWIRVRTANK